MAQMDMLQKAKLVADILDSEGTTSEQVESVLHEMSGRIATEPAGIAVDNFVVLAEAMRQLQYMEGTAAEQARQEAEASANAIVHRAYAFDGNRRGLARERVIEARSEGAMRVIDEDLVSAGYERVADILDSSVASGVSVVYYYPDESRYLSRETYDQMVTIMLAIIAEKENGQS